MTGLIPRSFIDDLLNRTDITEFIDAYVPLKKRGNSFLACCPFHNEKSPSFNVVPKKQFYHCFGCGASGNAISFAMNHMHLGFVEAVEALAGRLGLQVPREGGSEPNRQAPNLYKLLERVSKLYQHTLKTRGSIAIDYLKSRQLSGDVARMYQLGYALPEWQFLEKEFQPQIKELITTGMLIQKDNGATYDRYRQRIMFPIHDRQGRIIGFGGRAITAEQKPKYLNSPETVIFQKNRELYGLHQIIQQSSPIDSIIIVEGYLDVIALAQHGVTNAVATLGTATSAHHLQLLLKHTKRLYFCFDGDNAGRQAAWRALESCLPHLNQGLEVSFVFLPEGHDPDSLIREQTKSGFLKHLKTAIPFNQFFFANFSKTIDRSTPAGKSQLIAIAKSYLLKMEEGPYRQLIIAELAQMTRIEPHRINQIIADQIDWKINDLSVNIMRTPIRVATAILLQSPEVYDSCREQLNQVVLDGPKQNVLQEILNQVRENSTISTAALVESWRESSIFESLTKLAIWDHQVPDDALAKEFLDNVLFLAKQNQEKKIQQLLEKSRIQGLTESERQQLQIMLKRRHNMNHENINPE